MTVTASFKTKTGYCHLLEDRIVLSKESKLSEIDEVMTRKSIGKTLTLYGAFAVGLLYLAFQSYSKDEQAQTTIIAALALFLIYGIVVSINNSTTPIVMRNQIIQTKFKKAIFGITRARFEVFFKDENGKLKKRLILLPGAAANGKELSKRAVQVMRDNGLLN